MNIINIEENRNNIVKKHNELIKAKGELDGTAQKMLAMLISMIRVDDTEFQKYALKIDDYKKEVDTQSKDKEFYVNKALELMRNPFYIMENGKRKFFNWCSVVEPDEIEGYIIFQIHQDLKPYLLKLQDNFTKYYLINIMKLKGKYSPRLYELFKSKWNEYKHYHKSAKSYTFELKIDWLKEFLSISKGYKYNDIRRRIIDKAKEDFKEYTDIQFTYKEQKIGRKVDRLIITVKDNNQGSNDFMRDLNSFIKFIRNKYKATGSSFFAVQKDDTKIFYKIDDKELLYSQAMYTDGTGDIVSYNKEESFKNYEIIYNNLKKFPNLQDFIFTGKDLFELYIDKPNEFLKLYEN